MADPQMPVQSAQPAEPPRLAQPAQQAQPEQPVAQPAQLAQLTQAEPGDLEVTILVGISQNVMKATSISFNTHGFRAAFDVQMVTTGNEKVDAHPTDNPTLWTYIDSKHILPPSDYKTMAQKDIKTNLTMKGDTNESKLKLWQCKNFIYKSGASTSSKSKDFFIWAEDMEIVNQPEWCEMTLSDTFFHTEKVNMPWLMTSGNMQPMGHACDKVGLFNFPTMENGRIKETEVQWQIRSFGGLEIAYQLTAVDHSPWGQELMGQNRGQYGPQACVLQVSNMAAL